MLDRFWEVLGYVFALNAEAFRIAITVPQGFKLALVVVLLAGFSQEIGQSIILFLNQVKPIRFVFSLFINAVLFAFGFFALVGSTWLITLLPWSEHVAWPALVTVLGLAYAPLLFAFLGALPYLGQPILSVLSIWHLLAMVVGFAAITGVDISESFGYVAFGWIGLQVLQHTLGRPVAELGKRIANVAAGVNLVTDRRALTQAMKEELAQASTRWQAELKQTVEEVRQGTTEALTSGLVTAVAHSTSSTPGAASLPVPDSTKSKQRGLGKGLRTVLGLLVLVVVTLVVLILLRPLREWWFGWVSTLPGLVRFVLNLLWIGIVALIVAGLLAPLETLGWWAGWYDDDIDTTINAGDLSAPATSPGGFERYIVYLDGIGKSTFEYLPDIEEFLDTLFPTLPRDIALVRGIMPYSVLNSPLDQDRPLAFFWKFADKLRFANPASILGLFVNIRNVLIVGVSADQRYGPLYNQGIAQVVFNGLVKNGYQLGSGTPVTFIGYSGGGQMSCACAPYLKRALSAPVDVISLGGVISANCNILQLEHLYHLVGDKDGVERIGPIMFPGRWQVFPLSYWNRGKRRGKITFIPMGPVGHQVPGGILDPKLILPHGRSSLSQTIETIKAILQGKIMEENLTGAEKTSNYAIFQSNPLVQSQTYPLNLRPDANRYIPIGDWLGRLILPPKDGRFKGVYYEIHHAPPEHWPLVGRVVKLCWSDSPTVRQYVQAATQDVHFSAEAEYSSRFTGVIHPVRLNHWLQVDPLESLAGSHPEDDMVVMVEDPQITQEGGNTILRIHAQPMEVTGRYYGLVRFLGPVEETDQFRIVHFNRQTRAFDGPEEVVRVPPVKLAEAYGSYPSTAKGIEQSPCNEQGWYIYGAQDATGQFVVQAWAPRSLLRLQPDRVVFGGGKTSYRYIRRESWADVVAQKGKVSSVLCSARDNGRPEAIADAVNDWREGDRTLLLHNYGGIGGEKKEPAAATPIFFGHFAFGRADVVRDPLADELRFDIRYYQVYAHNVDGLIAGTLHWSRFQGDRQRGWLGTRPTCDIVVKLDCFTGNYDFDGELRSPFSRMEAYLQVMTARYRIGDGTGGTFVGPSNNCSQDSNQALFASIQYTAQDIGDNQTELRDWAARHPEEGKRLQKLTALDADLKHALQPFGKPRPDWEKNEFNLGSSLQDQPLRNLLMGLGSWRTVLPRKASDVVVSQFLKYGASAWVLRTSQVGGYDSDIEPVAPMTF